MPLASVTTVLGIRVTASTSNTIAGAPGLPPLPSPVTSIRVTVAPATGSLLTLS